jgi:DNA-binding Xre family transcriptional regulator
MKKKDLMREADISTATLTKLNRGENLNTDILVRICNALSCNVADIMDILPNKAEG